MCYKKSKNLSVNSISKIINIVCDKTGVSKLEIVKNILENGKNIPEDAIIMFINLYQPNTRESFAIIDSIIERQEKLSEEVLGKILSSLSLVTVENIALVSDILEKYENISEKNLDIIVDSRIFKESPEIRKLLIKTQGKFSEETLLKILTVLSESTEEITELVDKLLNEHKNISKETLESIMKSGMLNKVPNGKKILKSIIETQNYFSREFANSILDLIFSEKKIDVDLVISFLKRDAIFNDDLLIKILDKSKTSTIKLPLEDLDFYDERVLCQMLEVKPLSPKVFEEMLSRTIKDIPYAVEFYKQVLENHSSSISDKYFNMIMFQAIVYHEKMPDLIISVLKSKKNLPQEKLEDIIEKCKLYGAYDIDLLTFMLQNGMRISDKKIFEVLQDSIYLGDINKDSPIVKMVSGLYPKFPVDRLKTLDEDFREVDDLLRSCEEYDKKFAASSALDEEYSYLTQEVEQVPERHQSRKARDLSTKKTLSDIYHDYLRNPESKGQGAQTTFFRALKMIDEEHRRTKGKKGPRTIKQLEDNLRRAVSSLNEADKLYMQNAIEENPEIVETINMLSPSGRNFGSLIKIALGVNSGRKDMPETAIDSREEDMFEEVTSLPKHRTQIGSVADAEPKVSSRTRDRLATIYGRPTVMKDQVVRKAAPTTIYGHQSQRGYSQNPSMGLEGIHSRQEQISGGNLLTAALVSTFLISTLGLKSKSNQLREIDRRNAAKKRQANPTHTSRRYKPTKGASQNDMYL